ncbi:MAG: hypothetical protein H7257_01905 [Taibaiella sp.]|nr:hypothetical protein [Taibaiella sp.]
MTGNYNAYEVKEVNADKSIKYLFFSRGDSDIFKAVAFDYIQDFKGYPLFNLGFGDYILETEEIDDSVNSNNGDMHTVFYTVLSTVPKFFVVHPNALMVVEGSDHTHDFWDKCKKDCKKNCTDTCKNLNRRIKTYRYFVNKNYATLIKDYSFFGGTREMGTVIIHDDYEIGREYDLVFCKRNISLPYEN